MNSIIRGFDFDDIDCNKFNRMDFNCLTCIEQINQFDSSFQLLPLKKIIKSINSGKTPEKSKLFDKGEIPFIRAECLEHGCINILNVERYISRETSDYYLSSSKIKDGEVLFTIAGTIGNCVINNGVVGNTNQAIAIISFNENEITKEYFVLLTKSQYFKLQAKSATTFGAIPNINIDKLGKLIIPLPSIDEQRRTLPLIEAKIKVLEDKFKELGEEKETASLQNVVDTIICKNYDSSFNNNKDMTKYFAKIFNELDDYLSFNNAYHKDSDNVELAPLSEILENGVDLKTKDNSTRNKIVGLDNIDSFSGKIIESDSLSNDETINSDKVRFKKNDIMFAKMRPYLGKFIIVNDDNEDFIGSSELFGLKLKEDVVDIDFVRFLLSSKYVTNQYKQYFTGNGKPRISRANLLKINIPKKIIDFQADFVTMVNEKLRETSHIISKMKSIQSTIDMDLNKYILHGYSDDLFTLSEGEIQ